VWKLPLGGGGGETPRGSTQSPAGQSPGPAGRSPGADGPSGTPAVQPAAGPPTFIRQTGPNFDDFDPTLKVNACREPEEERPKSAFQIAVTTAENDYTKQVAAGTVQIGYRMKDAPADMPPYYVAVVVKPQHEIDANGRSTAVTDNRQLGFVAKARNVYEGQGTDWKYVTYPDDFSMLVDGKTVKAAPLSQDPGAWTVVFRHATSDTDHKSIFCTGFDSGP
jgi:hypothetical protein